jgi:hypothetical protein
MLSRDNAPMQGLEPQLSEPESDVLPIILHGKRIFSYPVVPPRIELGTHGLQPYALPIKLKNQIKNPSEFLRGAK